MKGERNSPIEGKVYILYFSYVLAPEVVFVFFVVFSFCSVLCTFPTNKKAPFIHNRRNVSGSGYSAMKKSVQTAF